MSALGQKQTYSDPFLDVRFRGKADVIQGVAECPLLTQSGHLEVISYLQVTHDHARVYAHFYSRCRRGSCGCASRLSL